MRQPVAKGGAEPRGEEHWAQKGAVRLYLWRKRLAPAQGATPLVLVHGSSLSALPSYDLQVPGQSDYSMMDWFARQGYDVWTLDHEGYGRSTVTERNADIACGVEDLRVAVRLIRQVTRARQVALYGLSSGSLRAGAYAGAEPDAVSHLVLDAFVYTGAGSPTLAKRKEGLEFFRTHSRRPIDRDFILGIFTRDKPGTTDPAVAVAVADAQLVYGDSVPTGTYLDMTQNLPVVDPRAIRAPTLIVRGEHDGIASMEDLLEFFRLLPVSDKQIAVLPGLAHSSQLGVHRHRMWRSVHAFLRRDA